MASPPSLPGPGAPPQVGIREHRFLGAPVALQATVHLAGPALPSVADRLDPLLAQAFGTRQVAIDGDGPDPSVTERRWEGESSSGPVEVRLDRPPPGPGTPAKSPSPLRLRIRRRRRDGELLPLLGVGMLGISAVAGTGAILFLGADPVAVTTVSGLNAFAGSAVYIVGLLRLRQWVDASVREAEALVERLRPEVPPGISSPG